MERIWSLLQKALKEGLRVLNQQKPSGVKHIEKKKIIPREKGAVVDCREKLLMDHRGIVIIRRSLTN
jgi:hypothetical protein